MNARSSLQSEGLRTDQMVPGVRTQPPLLLMDGQCMVSGSERGAWSREEALRVWSGLVSDVIMGQTYNFMPRLCHLCCAAVVSVG